MPRVHITGASGSGTTTLGRALAERLGCTHVDSDDVFWLPTEPAFTQQRPAAERNATLQRLLDPASDWVSSGSLSRWASGVEDRFDLVAFLRVPTSVRRARLQAREEQRLGAAAIAPGGPLHARHLEFMAWAERYDTAGVEQRSLALHEQWLAALPCSVIRFTGETRIEDALDGILGLLDP